MTKKIPEYPPESPYRHGATLVFYLLGFIEEGKIPHLPYAGGKLDQPGDLMELLSRLAYVITAK